MNTWPFTMVRPATRRPTCCPWRGPQPSAKVICSNPVFFAENIQNQRLCVRMTAVVEQTPISLPLAQEMVSPTTVLARKFNRPGIQVKTVVSLAALAW